MVRKRLTDNLRRTVGSPLDALRIDTRPTLTSEAWYDTTGIKLLVQFFDLLVAVGTILDRCETLIAYIQVTFTGSRINTASTKLFACIKTHGRLSLVLN